MSAAAGLDWKRRGVCVVETPDAPEIWTPDRKPARTVLRHLEQMCQRCPVRPDCAAEAVADQAQAGMYAGVWVPQRQRSTKQAWADAMQRLEHLAGVTSIAVDEDALGVSA
ncbi:WhiB family transcriptional regulator [Mycolicibacterium fortuitum]|uniref:WhiB family transcriptional regulator n=1 Tax=Mycolicibacterium fortuitum TaxID=1766 RepID=UPI003AAE4BB5